MRRVTPTIDVNAAVARMRADVDAAFEVFGSAASTASLLADQLTVDTGVCRAADLPGDHSVGREWTARAARLISEVAVGSEAAVRQCAERAFDDRDGRVRGVAWCLLAEMYENDALRGTVTTIIADEFQLRVREPGTYPEPDEDAQSFALLVSAAVMCASGAQMLQGMEREYIAAHGGSDASAIEASPSAALGFLDHADSDRRLAALRVAARAGQSDRAAREAIYEVMIGDPDDEVRVAAIVAYAGMFRGSSDQRCLRRLAEVVLDEDQPLWHRFVAYTELFTVSGRSHSQHPLRCADDEKLARLRDGAFDAEWPLPIDWEFVRECAAAQ